MIRIAYVINYIVKNGPSSVVLNLINNLDKTKYEISLITLFSGNDERIISYLKEKNVEVYECKTLSRAKCLLGQRKEFEEIAKTGQFDILHTHGLIPDILSSHLTMPIKKVTTLHNNMYEDYFNRYGYVKSRIFIGLHLAAIKKMNKCVCCSKSVYQVMKKNLGNATYIRNGIEPIGDFTVVTREELDIPDKAQVFLYVGGLNPGKNIVWLIETFVQNHNQNEYLLVLGEGVNEAECREKADNHVRMLGFQADPIAYMNISDVYVSASKTEGFSISVLEALTCGLGLLLSDIPSHREVIEMGQEIYLGEIFTPKEFDKAICKLRKCYFEKDRIKNFYKLNLSAKTMTINYEREYEAIMP